VEPDTGGLHSINIKRALVIPQNTKFTQDKTVQKIVS